MNTSGFYKLEDETLLYSPTTVESATYFLNAEIHETYTYPVDGWYWFNNIDEVKDFFNLVEVNNGTNS